MRLAFTSDLHVDHHPEVVARIGERAAAAGAELLVVAGDVAPRPERLEGVLASLARAVPRVAFVPGNHDLWVRSGEDSRTRYLEEIPALCRRAGVDCLPAGPVVLPGLTLVGQTGWYDFSLRDPALDGDISMDDYRRGRYGKLSWTDRQFVHWSGIEDDAALTAWMVERLAADLAAAPRDRPCVVVTHMLPFVELATSRPLPWGFVRGFLGASALGEAIRSAADRGLPVVYTIAGHTHFARTARIGDFTAETSPIGYPREYGRFGVDLDGCVEKRLRVIDL